MVSSKIRIEREEGFHLRPVGVLADTVKQYDCKTWILHKDQKLDATKVMLIVAACIKCGTELTFVCEGPEEKKCLAAINKLADNNFELKD